MTGRVGALDSRNVFNQTDPKLDVAGSIPDARSNDDAGLQGTCSPAFALLLPLCVRSHRISPTLPTGSHADRLVRAAPSTCDVQTRGWTSPSGHSSQLARGW
jgi:hypothetical protein